MAFFKQDSCTCYYRLFHKRAFCLVNAEINREQLVAAEKVALSLFWLLSALKAINVNLLSIKRQKKLLLIYTPEIFYHYTNEWIPLSIGKNYYERLNLNQVKNS